MKLHKAIILSLVMTMSPATVLADYEYDKRENLQEMIEKTIKKETYFSSFDTEIKNDYKRYKRALLGMTKGEPTRIHMIGGYESEGYINKNKLELGLRNDILDAMKETREKYGNGAKTIFVLDGTNRGVGEAYRQIHFLKKEGKLNNAIVTGLYDYKSLYKSFEVEILKTVDSLKEANQQDINEAKKRVLTKITGYQDIAFVPEMFRQTYDAKPLINDNTRGDYKINFLKDMLKEGRTIKEVTYSIHEGGRSTLKRALDLLIEAKKEKRIKIQTYMGYEPAYCEGYRASRQFLKNVIDHLREFRSENVIVKKPLSEGKFTPVEYYNSVKSLVLDARTPKFLENYYKGASKELLPANISRRSIPNPIRVKEHNARIERLQKDIQRMEEVSSRTLENQLIEKEIEVKKEQLYKLSKRQKVLAESPKTNSAEPVDKKVQEKSVKIAYNPNIENHKAFMDRLVNFITESESNPKLSLENKKALEKFIQLADSPKNPAQKAYVENLLKFIDSMDAEKRDNGNHKSVESVARNSIITKLELMEIAIERIENTKDSRLSADNYLKNLSNKINDLHEKYPSAMEPELKERAAKTFDRARNLLRNQDFIREFQKSNTSEISKPGLKYTVEAEPKEKKVGLLTKLENAIKSKISSMKEKHAEKKKAKQKLKLLGSLRELVAANYEVEKAIKNQQLNKLPELTRALEPLRLKANKILVEMSGNSTKSLWVALQSEKGFLKAYNATVIESRQLEMKSVELQEKFVNAKNKAFESLKHLNVEEKANKSSILKKGSLQEANGLKYEVINQDLKTIQDIQKEATKSQQKKIRSMLKNQKRR